MKLKAKINTSTAVSDFSAEYNLFAMWRQMTELQNCIQVSVIQTSEKNINDIEMWWEVDGDLKETEKIIM